MTIEKEMVEKRTAICDYIGCGHSSGEYAVYTCAVCKHEFCAKHVLGVNIYRSDESNLCLERCICRSCIERVPIIEIIHGLNRRAWEGGDYYEDIPRLMEGYES